MHVTPFPYEIVGVIRVDPKTRTFDAGAPHVNKHTFKVKT